MKLRLFFSPSIVVCLLGGAAALLWWANATVGGVAGLLAMLAALFYSGLFLLAAYAWGRSLVIERWKAWDTPQRLLILAPHEDDCVIAAGGLGARNRRLGGAVRVVYLAPDEAPGMAEVRAEEARAAWREAGVDPKELRHFDLLPRLRERNPQKLRAAVPALRAIIDDFEPTVLVMPMFEGGHIQHDMTAALVGTLLTPQDRFEVYEAPEYGPYVSLQNTPHRVVMMCARWLFGLVSYCGPPDGIDGREIQRVRLDAKDLDCKQRMLAAFASQNAPSLVETYRYPDRIVRWEATCLRRHPYDFGRSLLRLKLAARRVMPAGLADRLFAVRDGAVGREGAVTDWHEEWSVDRSSGAGGIVRT
jgi:LmbE family N-acetylglucosaminyl deacetylase